MALESVVRELVLIVGTMLAVTTLVLVGPTRLAAALRGYKWRIRKVTLALGLLIAVLLVRLGGQGIIPRLQLSVVGLNITPQIDRVERAIFPENPVVFLQGFESELVTSFFVFIYIHGYAFLLLFPFIAYFSLRSMDRFSSLVVAFTANYAIGLVCYVFFIAYGPRNLLPLEVAPLLYDAYPQSRFLTNEVNQNTNVFPSLHTSLSMTVLFLAWVTRKEYPLWFPIAAVFALSVVVSTMFLGIHWFSDVVAGTILAAISVYIGLNLDLEGLQRSTVAFVRTHVDPLLART